MIRYTLRQNSELVQAGQDDFNYWDPVFTHLEGKLAQTALPLETLGLIADIGTGCTPKKEEYSYERGPDDALILKVANLSNHEIRYMDEYLSFVPPEVFTRGRKGHLRRYDILILGAAHQRTYIGCLGSP